LRIRGDNREWRLIFVTCDKFFAGINGTGEQLSLVTMTPAIAFFPGVVDTALKNAKSLKFIAGVNDTADHRKSVTKIIAIRDYLREFFQR
jgi:hypothetical protein